jgi:glucokinase
MDYCLGIDIGGTKTAVCIADLNGKIIETGKFPTEPQLGVNSLIEKIVDCYKILCLKSNVKSSQIRFAGVASPGPLDLKTGRIVHIATMGFVDVPIKDMLSKALELPVFLENDANCAALAESIVGAGKNAKSVVYVTISTGIGCGITIGRKILSGAFSSAGEVGHLTVVPNGKECPCGKKGCLELYASGTAIAKTASDLRNAPIETKDVFVKAKNGDSEMQEIIDAAADKLGLGLSHIIQVIDPDVIVLGGSVTKDYKLFAAQLYSALNRYVQPIKGREFNIKISQFDGEQVILGAVLFGISCFSEDF